MAKIWNSLCLLVSRLLDIYDDFENAFGYDPRENFNNTQEKANEAMEAGTIAAIIIGVVFGVIFVAVLVFIIVSAVKAKKKTSEFVDVVKNKIAQNVEQEKTKNICPYCGTRLKDEENRCPSCGAQRK